MDEFLTRESALMVENLTVEVASLGGWLPAVTNISFGIGRGEMVGLVGESGSGKTLTGLAIMGLLNRTARRSSGTIVVSGERLAGPGGEELRRGRRRNLAMIFQNPMTSLNPSMVVGDQIVEAIRRHDPDVSRGQARQRAIELMDRVEIRNAASAIKQHPHEFSGGMQQRVMIAIAIACRPDVLIADEPTTALDVTVQAGVMALLERLRESLGLAILLISHNLALVSGRCERVIVMYAGELIESGSAVAVLQDPKHPYVDALIRSTPDYALLGRTLQPLEGRLPGPGEAPRDECRFAPRCDYAVGACVAEHPSEVGVGQARWARCIRALELSLPGLQIAAATKATDRATEARSTFSTPQSRGGSHRPILQLEAITKRYSNAGHGGQRRTTTAVDHVDLEIREGESLGLVGESGSGKSTLGNIATGLTRPDSGRVQVGGDDVFAGRVVNRSIWRKVQIVFQDPYSSLNPAMRVGEILAEPLQRWFGMGRRDALREADTLLEKVGLDSRLARASPARLSGGQRQRVSIARAIAVRPQLIVCDEAVSSLDVSVQAQILTLLRKLQRESRIAYLFITHDINVVRLMSERIAIMSEGRIVETCIAESLALGRVKDPYTRRLLAAVPVMKGATLDHQ